MTLRQLTRAIGALLVATIGLLMTATAGFTMPSLQSIDVNATGSLTIHRYLDSGTNSLTARNTQQLTPLPGAVFGVQQVIGVDLTTPEGWAAALAYQADLSTLAGHLGPELLSAPTDDNGITRLSNLAVGLYYVHEEYVLGADGLPDHSIMPSTDFLVTIPTGGEQWQYDLDVTPKVNHLSLVKSVADGNVGIAGEDSPVAGTVLTYSLRGDIPDDGLRGFGGFCLRNGSTDVGVGLDPHGFDADGYCAAGAVYAGTSHGAAYEIIDDLSSQPVTGTDPVLHTSDFVEFSAADWPGSVQVSIDGGTGQALTACPPDPAISCDYVLTQSASRISVSMTDHGLQQLADAIAADRQAKVLVAVQGRVKPAVSDFPGSSLWLPDTAILIPNGLAKITGTQIPSNTVHTVFAHLRVHKVAAGTGADLAGAVFTLYRTKADALDAKNPLAVSAATDTHGIAVFRGLHVNDYQNDGPADDYYWLVETTTPAGYVSSQRPIAVRVLQDGTTEGADASLGVQVVNEPVDVATPTTPPAATPPAATPPTLLPTQFEPSVVVPLPGLLAYTGIQLSESMMIAAALIALGMTMLAGGYSRRSRERS